MKKIIALIAVFAVLFGGFILYAVNNSNIKPGDDIGLMKDKIMCEFFDLCSWKLQRKKNLQEQVKALKEKKDWDWGDLNIEPDSYLK